MKKVSHTTNVVSALTAQTQLGQIIRRASAKNERFLVDRDGEPAVIIMSVKDYIAHFAPEPDWLTQIRAKSKERGTDKLSMPQINDVIAEARRTAKKCTKFAVR